MQDTQPPPSDLNDTESTGQTPMTEPAWRRHPAVRFGLPFVAIAVIAGAILLLSGWPRRGDIRESAELEQARLGALASDAPKKGQPAPDFALRSLDGQVIRLSELRGKIVLVNFWATWCAPCRAEMPDLEAVYQQERDSLVVLSVNVEGVSIDDARRLASDFRDELGLTFPIVLDSPNGDVFQQYKLKGLPDSFFIDQNGILRDVQFGPMNRATILKKLEATRRPGS